jgi:guanylate kinase
MGNKRSSASQEGTPGMLLVISGPAGVGKDTVWQLAAAQLPTFSKAITCTTRPRREGEQEGVHYYFVSEAEFDRLIHNDELLEWAHVHSYRYGVPQKSVLGRLNEGQDVVCVIDVQGAQRIRGLFPWAVLVFIKPPQGTGVEPTEVLKERIAKRGSVDAAELERRLQTAAWELTHIPLYDHQIVNDDAPRAARDLVQIVQQEQAKEAPEARAPRERHNSGRPGSQDSSQAEEQTGKQGAGTPVRTPGDTGNE